MRKAILFVIFAFGCDPAVAPEPEPKPVVEPEPTPDPAAIADEMYELGRRTAESEQRTAEAKQQLVETKQEIKEMKNKLTDMERVASFIFCLKDKTGKDIRGDDGSLEKYMDRKEGRACQKMIVAMTPEEVHTYYVEKRT